MQQAIGLGPNQVVMLQPEQPVAPRPDVPFATFDITVAGATMGADWMQWQGDAVSGGDVYRYKGLRMLNVQFQFYGETHDQAFGMAATWQASLRQEPTQDALSVGGLTVWQPEAIQNIGAMMFTGYEPRTALDCSFGVQSAMDVTVGSIETVPVSGTVGQEPPLLDIDFTATRGS